MNKISKEELLDRLSTLKDEGDNVLLSRYESLGVEYVKGGPFDAWRNKVLAFLHQLSFVPSEILLSIGKCKAPYSYSDVMAIKAQVNTLMELIQEGYISCESKAAFDANLELENVFNKFHKVARQLRTRHSDRETLKIVDEYDVQDLLHSLLRLHFDDIRPEEWTPSYAGGCVRMDFLLKEIQTVIEVKKTRSSMTAKSLGEELIIDIEKYKTHPDCKRLYCFVYDPEGLLGNPVGIKNDLETTHKDFLKVVFNPE